MLAVSVIVALAFTIEPMVIGTVTYFDPQMEIGGLALLKLLLVTAGLLAALIPGARAAFIEPMQALRSE